MRLIDKIRAMSVEELADFLITLSKTVYYDEDDEWEYVVSSWVTPWDTYPGWWSRDDVKAVVVDILLHGG